MLRRDIFAYFNTNGRHIYYNCYIPTCRLIIYIIIIEKTFTDHSDVAVASPLKRLMAGL